jgi:hypothetical protein
MLSLHTLPQAEPPQGQKPHWSPHTNLHNISWAFATEVGFFLEGQNKETYILVFSDKSNHAFWGIVFHVQRHELQICMLFLTRTGRQSTATTEQACCCGTGHEAQSHTSS